MAIGPNGPIPTPSAPINIETWATEALSGLQISSPQAPSTGISLIIPIRDAPAADINDASPPLSRQTRPRREPLRRDSLKRRDALLKGKEGSRRRQRWENDRLLNNPFAQPPLPSDWEVRPTYPVHSVPYYLAPLWNAGLSQRAAHAQKHEDRKHQAKVNDPAVKIPKELRATFKKAKAAKGMLQDLEEQVRDFVQTWEERELAGQKSEKMEIDSEDEEIVFVGRKGEMSDESPSPSSKKRKEEQEEADAAAATREKLILESLAEDKGAKFGRFLLYSIADYYNLTTRSVLVGDPARREAYIGIPVEEIKTGRRRLSNPQNGTGLPRPLWGLV